MNYNSHASSSGRQAVMRMEEKKKVRGKMHEEEDGSDANSCTAARIVASRSVDVADAEVMKEQASKLCGYLTKLSGKGPLRGYKPRWFVYDPRKCYLYCFKSPQDALPLGYIEIGDACFSYDVEGEEGQFEIRTDGKEFLLKVGTFVFRRVWHSDVMCHFLSSVIGRADTPILA